MGVEAADDVEGAPALWDSPEAEAEAARRDMCPCSLPEPPMDMVMSSPATCAERAATKLVVAVLWL